MLTKIARVARRACRSSEGSVAIIVALSMTALIGFGALGTEIVFALFKQRQMQATASSAAFAGATALMTGHPASPAAEALAVAASNGFTNGTAGAVVTVNIPPKSGQNTSNNKAVEVIVSQPQTLPLTAIFRAGAFAISARAVAIAGNNASDCLLSLAPAGNPGLLITSGATVNASTCGIAVNGSGSNALEVIDGARLTANSVTVVGTVDSSDGTITSTNGVQTLQDAVADPYANVAVPTYSGCAFNNYSTSAAATLSATGTYCGGISLYGSDTVTMNPGVYILNGGYFSVSAGVTVKGTGVTIVLTGSGTSYATLSISGGATIDLSAPTTGATAGLVFFQDPNAKPASTVNSIAGGGTLNVIGALYFPAETVEFSNGSETSTSACTQVIAWSLEIEGGTSFNSNCAGTGAQTIGGSPSQLVE